MIKIHTTGWYLGEKVITPYNSEKVLTIRHTDGGDYLIRYNTNMDFIEAVKISGIYA